MEAESQEKSRENVAEEVSAPWFKKALQINQQIIDDSVLRLKIYKKILEKKASFFQSKLFHI